MRVHIIGLIGVLGAVFFCLAGCTTSPSQQALVLEELKDIRVTLNTVTNQLAQMEAKRQKVLDFSAKYTSYPDSSANIEKLVDIELPDTPSKEDVKEYIEKIQAATEGQRSFSSRDPQIELYAKVGKVNLPLLIDALSGRAYGMQSDFHLIPAISNLADESSKSLILDALPAHQGLVKVTQDKGWEQDAHDILLSELDKGQQVSTGWIEATALLNDPESYPLLRKYFIKSSNRSSTYKAIEHLPIEDMPGAVAEAWEECQFDHQYERQNMAMIAAEYGHLDALAYLIDALRSPPDQFSEYMHKQIRLAVLKVTGIGGSSDEQISWFDTNKDRLQFDPVSKKFVVMPEATPRPSGKE